MRVSVTDAKAQLTDLVKRAEEGEDIELTRHGQSVVRLVRTQPALTRDEIMEKRRKAIEQAMAGAVNALPGPGAARSAEFLYGDDGMPKRLSSIRRL
jgi:prevent-host-death family protein